MQIFIDLFYFMIFMTGAGKMIPSRKYSHFSDTECKIIFLIRTEDFNNLPLCIQKYYFSITNFL
mgnify:CR=1 FL=1